MDKEKFLEIKEKYGNVASFCFWEKNKGNTNFFENPNEELLKKLKTNIIVLGVNISRDLERGDFSNVHDGRSKSTDNRLYKALEGTDVYGAYFTDLYKSHVNGKSKEVFEHFNGHPEEQKKQFESLKEEIDFVSDGGDPLIIVCSKCQNENQNELLKHFRKFCEHVGHNYRYICINHYACNGAAPRIIKEQLKSAGLCK